METRVGPSLTFGESVALARESLAAAKILMEAAAPTGEPKFDEATRIAIAWESLEDARRLAVEASILVMDAERVLDLTLPNWKRKDAARKKRRKAVTA